MTDMATRREDNGATRCGPYEGCWGDTTPLPSFTVDDVRFLWPCGFIWFTKPRYRVKAGRRECSA